MSDVYRHLWILFKLFYLLKEASLMSEDIQYFTVCVYSALCWYS